MSGMFFSQTEARIRQFHLFTAKAVYCTFSILQRQVESPWAGQRRLESAVSRTRLRIPHQSSLKYDTATACCSQNAKPKATAA